MYAGAGQGLTILPRTPGIMVRAMRYTEVGGQALLAWGNVQQSLSSLDFDCRFEGKEAAVNTTLDPWETKSGLQGRELEP